MKQALVNGHRVLRERRVEAGNPVGEDRHVGLVEAEAQVLHCTMDALGTRRWCSVGPGRRIEDE